MSSFLGSVEEKEAHLIVVRDHRYIELKLAEIETSDLETKSPVGG